MALPWAIIIQGVALRGVFRLKAKLIKAYGNALVMWVG